MKRWLKRVLGMAAMLLLAFAAYCTWRFQHPPMPPGSVNLPAATSLPSGLSAQYFGTTSVVFRDGRNAVMVDALLTRPSMSKVLFGKLASDPAVIDDTLRRASLSHVDLLLISHTHYDHVLDAAVIADRLGSTIVGSSSTRQVALGANVAPSRIIVVNGGEKLEAGDFKVTVFRSLHSLGDRVPGQVTRPIRQPASAKEYKEGGTYAYLIEHRGLRILVHASANFVPGMYRGVHADVIFLATGGLAPQPADFTGRYWAETVEATGAKLVVPIHWDDFFQPLDRPLQPLRRFLDNVPLTMERIAPLAARDGVTIRYMPVIAPVDIEVAARSAAKR